MLIAAIQAVIYDVPPGNQALKLLKEQLHADCLKYIDLYKGYDISSRKSALACLEILCAAVFCKAALCLSTEEV